MKNWNLYIISLLLLALSISSCKVKKAAINNDNTIIIDDNTANNNDNNNNDNDNNDNDIVIDSKPDTVISIQPSLELKNEYNIALILPLLSDSLYSSYRNSTDNDLKDFNIPKKSKEALNFLEGAMMAIQNLNLNSKINIKVYDNQYSYTQTSFILKKLELENIDMVVGPIKKQNVQLVSNFAKKKDILMLSPFSPSKSAGNNYYKYIMAESTIDLHFKTITNFISDSLNRSSVKILYPNTSSGSRNAYELQDFIQKMNDTLSLTKSIKYAMVEVEANTNDRRNFKIEEYLDIGLDNTVIIVSFNEGFVHSMLTSLNTQLKDYKIKVFGMPNWKNSKSLRLDYFENLNVHFTNSKWIDEKDFETENFVNNFKLEYKAHPTEEAFLGYDLFSFFPLWLDKYGLDLDENIQKESFKGILNNYHFIPIDYNIESNLKPKSPRIENKNLHVIEYKNYELIKN